MKSTLVYALGIAALIFGLYHSADPLPSVSIKSSAEVGEHAAALYPSCDASGNMAQYPCFNLPFNASAGYCTSPMMPSICFCSSDGYLLDNVVFCQQASMQGLAAPQSVTKTPTLAEPSQFKNQPLDVFLSPLDRDTMVELFMGKFALVTEHVPLRALSDLMKDRPVSAENGDNENLRPTSNREYTPPKKDAERVGNLTVDTDRLIDEKASSLTPPKQDPAKADKTIVGDDNQQTEPGPKPGAGNGTGVLPMTTEWIVEPLQAAEPFMGYKIRTKQKPYKYLYFHEDQGLFLTNAASVEQSDENTTITPTEVIWYVGRFKMKSGDAFGYRIVPSTNVSLALVLSTAARPEVVTLYRRMPDIHKLSEGTLPFEALDTPYLRKFWTFDAYTGPAKKKGKTSVGEDRG